MNTNLTLDYTSIFAGDKNPIVHFFLTQSVFITITIIRSNI